MSHQTPPPAFWADKEKRWIARAQAFNVATAASAVAALNQHIGSSAGSLSSQKVIIQQGADGLFAWTPSSLRLLRQMGEDVSILDDIGRTSASSSPVKGNPPSPPLYLLLLKVISWTRDLRLSGGCCTARSGERPRNYCHIGGARWRRCLCYIACPVERFLRRAAFGSG